MLSVVVIVFVVVSGGEGGRGGGDGDGGAAQEVGMMALEKQIILDTSGFIQNDHEG